MSDSSMLPPAAWYADPTDPGALRYWDGAAWTDQTRPMVPEPVAPEPVAPEPVAPEPIVVPEPLAPAVQAPAVADPVPVPQPEVVVTETVAVTPLVPEPAAEPLVAEAVAVPVLDSRDLPPAVADPAAPLTGFGDAVAASEPQAAGGTLVVTTGDIAGRRIVRTVGSVVGVAVRAHSEFGEAAAFGGFGPVDHAELLTRTRAEALEKVGAAAAAAGADAVVGVRLKSGDVAGSLFEVAAYGTAVVTEAG